MNNTTAIPGVDAKPIKIEAFDLDGRTMRAGRPLAFDVEFDPRDGRYTATGDFHLMATGETREELESAVLDAIAFLWREYVVPEPCDFSADALSLRRRLEASFAAGDAAREA